ncbi:hypothetical protein BDW62DRAFT_199965 [Aspergillus aurantiobrunneus]
MSGLAIVAMNSFLLIGGPIIAGPYGSSLLSSPHQNGVFQQGLVCVLLLEICISFLEPGHTYALSFTECTRTYGPVMSLRIGRGTMVIPTSAFHAIQILDKRSVHTSNRPPSCVLGDLVFKGDRPMFMGADDR